MIDFPPPSYEQTVEAIARCEVPRANIRIAYEDYLQSDEVTISNIGTISEEKMRCLKKAVHPSYILSLSDTAQREAFHKFSRMEDRPNERAEARAWLESRNLMGNLPSFDAKKGVQDFARQLEAACEQAPGSALMVFGSSALTVKPEFLQRKDLDKLSADLYCLTQMYTASDAAESGIEFVFLGNDANSELDEK